MALVAVLDILLGCKMDGFEAGLKKGTSLVENFAGLISGKGIDIQGAFGKMGSAAGVYAQGLKALGDFMLELNALVDAQVAAMMANVHLAERMQVSTAELGAFRRAAVEAGGAVEGLVRASERFSIAIGQVQGGSMSAGEALAHLGLSADELAGKSKVDQMRALGEAINQFSKEYSAVDVDRISKQLLGRGWAEARVELQRFTEDYEELLARSKELAPPLSEDAVAVLRDATRASDDMNTAWESIKNTIALEFAQPFAAIKDAITEILIVTNKAIRLIADLFRLITFRKLQYDAQGAEGESKKVEGSKKLIGSFSTEGPKAADQGSKEAFEIIAQARQQNPVVEKLDAIKDILEKQNEIHKDTLDIWEEQSSGGGGDF